MKQHLLTLFLALAASVAPLFAQSGTCGTNLTWTFDTESGILTISGTGAIDSYNYDSYSDRPNTPWSFCREYITSVVISDGVTSIGDWAFYGCSSLTSITIPNSVTKIGESAFWTCTSLTSVTIPNSVTWIGHYAFYDCSKMTSVHISDIAAWCKIAFDDSYANPLYYAHNLYLNGTLITDLVIPNSVTSIGDYAFCECSSLTSVEIPNSVTSIEYEAFYNCSSLTSVEIPNSVTSIGNYAFYGCSSLTSVTIPNSVTSIGDGAFYYCSSLTSVTIPNSVITIEDAAFAGCSSLTSVTIPNSVITIEDAAFSGCSSLTSITIPNSVTSIGLYAFSGCSSLTSIVVENGNTKYDSRNNCNAIIETATNKLIAGCQNTVIPNSVTSIGNYAFYQCSKLTSITIPNSVTSIGYAAFEDCRSLTSVTIPNSVTSIGDGAFLYCSSLTSVTIPNSVTSIGDYAFCECSSLTSITIPNSVTSIGREAFGGCSSLTSVTIPNSVTSIGWRAFSECTGLTSITCSAVNPPVLDKNVFTNVDKSIPLYVPAQSVEAYKAADQWKDFTNILPITSSTPETFTITFLNYDGSELQSSEVEAGTMPQYNGTEPTKPADAQYTYTFAGWDKEVVAVTGDATYTAVFVSVVQCGTIETTDGITVWEDQLPYTWEGISFSTAGTETKTLQASDGCDSIVTFTLRVLYRNITLQENEAADFYTQFATDYNGVTVTTATLNRQFTQGKWATLCLPFDVNKALMTSLGLYNRVFEFRYAQQLDDETIQMYFAPAQTLEAGKGYIVNANTKLAQKTYFVFPNVTINTDSDNGDITSLTGYNDGTGRGNLYLVGTLRTGILQGTTTGNTWLGLKDNKLYYPNSTSGTPMRAYRAVFRCDIPVNASRLRIIADGETVTELQVMNGEEDLQETPPARKYIDNGILYIERNGITYTAQGQRLD